MPAAVGIGVRMPRRETCQLDAARLGTRRGRILGPLFQSPRLLPLPSLFPSPLFSHSSQCRWPKAFAALAFFLPLLSRPSFPLFLVLSLVFYTCTHGF